MATELRKLGASVTEGADFIEITPPVQWRAAEVHTYDDHRMAMSFALIGLKAEGVRILDPDCVTKTYPGFWSDLLHVTASSPL